MFFREGCEQSAKLSLTNHLGRLRTPRSEVLTGIVKAHAKDRCNGAAR
jgi:hypothetical protein